MSDTVLRLTWQIDILGYIIDIELYSTLRGYLHRAIGGKKRLYSILQCME